MDDPEVSEEQLRTGVVFSVQQWEVPMKRNLLSALAVSLDITFDLVDVDGMTDEQFAAFAEEFDNRFMPEFRLFRRAWFADLRQSVRQAEVVIQRVGRTLSNLRVKETKMLAFVDEANTDLVEKCETGAQKAAAIAQACYNAAVTESQRRAKKRRRKPKAKVSVAAGLVTPIVPAKLTAFRIVRGTWETPSLDPRAHLGAHLVTEAT